MAGLAEGADAGAALQLGESTGVLEAAAGASTGTDEAATTRHMTVVAGLHEQTGDFTSCDLESCASIPVASDASRPPLNGERPRAFCTS